jgi:DNA-binding transcriptional LysR family regulator
LPFARDNSAVQLDVLRSFLIVAEAGSLSRAAERMRVSQSTLTRQMQSLETEVGGRLLERNHGGVALTAAGQLLADKTRTIVGDMEGAIAAARRLARGETGSLRLGYLLSAATDFLNPALSSLRRRHPEIKIKLVDLSPGEQLAALRAGQLDAALLGNCDLSIRREFHVQRIATVPVIVALPENHPLASRETVPLVDLRPEAFVGAHDADVPGYNDWIVQICRTARFRPRFIENADSLAHALSLLVAENAVTFLPQLAKSFASAGVIFRPLAGRANWELLLVAPRGKVTAPVRALLESLTPKQRARSAG